MKKWTRRLAASICLICCICAVSTAYAGAKDADDLEPTPTFDLLSLLPETTPTPIRPTSTFTPDGTGTVLDNVTDADGKEFFTITTPNENVFFLVIDRERDSENVYFLDAVTELDLIALAKAAGVEPTPTPEPPPTPKPTIEVSAEPQKERGPARGGVIIGILLVLAGGAGFYYFKFIRGKQHDTIDEEALEYEDEDYPEDEEEGSYEDAEE